MNWFRRLLDHPIKIGLLALFLACGSLLAEGTLIDLWDLKREKARLEARYKDTLKYNQDLSRKIQQARTSDKFIARQAREQFDMVKEDELVFIFENGTPDSLVLETPSLQR